MPNRVLVRPPLLSRSSNSAILKRSQRSQRGSLCVGQALHLADIEALVGPVPPQRPLQFSALQIPYLDSIIIPATGQEEAIRAQLERLDCPLMRNTKRLLPTSTILSPMIAHVVTDEVQGAQAETHKGKVNDEISPACSQTAGN